MPDLFPTFDVPIIQETEEKHNVGYSALLRLILKMAILCLMDLGKFN